MDVKSALAAAVCAVAWGVSAENLVPGGDFSSAAANLAPECRAEEGRVSLFTEDRSWNKCGKCEITVSRPDREASNCLVHAACAVIGVSPDGKAGFPVTPGTKYDFSFDICGTVPSVMARVVFWTGDDYWHDRKAEDLKFDDNKVTESWSVRKGSFRAPEKARRAALMLSVWSSSRWPTLAQHKVGDYFLFDNVKVEPARQNLALDGSVPPEAVSVRKAVVPGEAFSDLVSFADGRTPAQAKTLVRVRRTADALFVDVTAEEPGELVVGDAENPWSGDTVELFFEGKDDARTKTQVAFNGAGARYTDVSNAVSDDGWDLRTKVGKQSWRASVKLPFAFLGWKEPKGEIAFNVARTRPKAKTIDVWSPGKGSSLHDPSGYGRLLIDGYGAAFKAEFGTDGAFAGRADFESRWAAAETTRREKKLAKFKEAKFSVAPVSTSSDWTQPFLPDEIFDPPEKIHLKAAVNEIRALSLAVANLTGRTEDYVVTLETAENPFVGERGLAGFPSANVVVRQGVRFRDVATSSPSTRFDPLPRMDELGHLAVPPHEAGLVWYDFDCTGVRPGLYRGRLRVIPLCEEGSCSGKNRKQMDYRGKMQTIPVTLEVVNAEIPLRAAAPAGYFGEASTQEMFDLAFQVGMEYCQINTWSFSFKTDGQGNLDPARPNDWAKAIPENVSRQRAFAKKHGFTPKFMLVYTALDAVRGLYGAGRQDPEKFRRIWPQYVKAVKKTMNEAGVPDSDYFIEVQDEPQDKDLDFLLEAHRLAKETEPTVRLAMLLATWNRDIAKLEKFIPHADVWILHRNAWFPSSGDKREFVGRVRAAGKEIAHYSCDTSMRVPIHNYYRQHAWFGEHHGVSGNYMYHLVDSAAGVPGWGDFKGNPYGGVIYHLHGARMPSLRLMALREGFTDVKFLAALKTKNERAKDAEIAAFLKTAAEEVVVRRPNDAMLPDRLRDRARELLAR